MPVALRIVSLCQVPAFSPQQTRKALVIPKNTPTSEYLRACCEAKLLGTWHRDEIRNITGTSGEIIHSNLSTGAFYEAAYVGIRTYADGEWHTGDFGFDASRVVPTGSENVPQHVWQPCIIYLGK